MKNDSNNLWRLWLLILVLATTGIFINWRETAGEFPAPRQSLNSFPAQIGLWTKFGADLRFSADIESILRADDYLMRDYVSDNGKTANVYIGYYASQKSGATYHSPRNCLPGAGWTMTSPDVTEITTPTGRSFTVNRYIVENNKAKYLMLYWYQGRGRIVANEYVDKLSTIYDSVRLRRSDGSLVRIITAIGDSEAEAIKSASDLAVNLEGNLSAFVPD